MLNVCKSWKENVLKIYSIVKWSFVKVENENVLVKSLISWSWLQPNQTSKIGAWKKVDKLWCLIGHSKCYELKIVT